MEQLVKVVKLNDDGSAVVSHERLSACSGDCHRCAGCGSSGQTMLLEVRNPIGAKPGDMVVIRSESAPVLAAAAILYLCPIALFFMGYFLGAYWLGQGGLWGCCAFLLGIGGAAAYDRLVVKKKKTVYTITGWREMPLPEEKRI